jgi:hypothetical protein
MMENNMFKWIKDTPTFVVFGWLGVGALAIVIVLVFVKRLVGMDG